MAVIAVAGRKGGIGKSTIAGNLAGEFASSGRSVALLDADPQHSLAAWAAEGDGVLATCVHEVDGGKPEVLKTMIRKAEKHFDLVVIDTPPGMPDVAFQAALLADLALLPCGPSPLDLFALKHTLNLVLKARAERRTKRPRIRLVPSKVTSNTNLGRNLSSSLDELGRKVLPPIGQRVVLAEAVTRGLTICEYAPSSVAHQEFEELAKAVGRIIDRD